MMNKSHETPTIAFLDIDQKENATLRTATSNMIVRNLENIDPAVAHPHNVQNMNERARTISEFESALLDPTNDPKTAWRMVWNARLQWNTPLTKREHSITVVHKAQPVLYATFNDEYYDDSWDDYYCEDREPTTRDMYRSPSLHYIIGEAEALKDDTLAHTALAGMFAVIESRQSITKFELSAQESQDKDYEKVYNSLYWFGTSPMLRTSGQQPRALPLLPTNTMHQCLPFMKVNILITSLVKLHLIR